MTAVQSLCERVIHIADGRIIGDGDPTEKINNYLTSAMKNNKRQQRMNVGDALTIISLSLSPNPAASGSDLRFELDLAANSPLRLSEAVLLIHASEGPRVGLVDLRPAGFPFNMKIGERLRIEGTLQSIPLVDRRYRVGLYIDSGTFVGDIPDLIDLSVTTGEWGNSYAQYRSEVRGWVEFTTQCSSRLITENELSAPI